MLDLVGLNYSRARTKLSAETNCTGHEETGAGIQNSSVSLTQHSDYQKPSSLPSGSSKFLIGV
jgi:hypothetical protein